MFDPLDFIDSHVALLALHLLCQVLEQFGQEDPDTESAEKEAEKEREKEDSDRDKDGEGESKGGGEGDGEGAGVVTVLDSTRSSPASEKLTDRMARRNNSKRENK